MPPLPCRGMCSGAEVARLVAVGGRPPSKLYTLDLLVGHPGQTSADAFRLLLQHGAPANREPGQRLHWGAACLPACFRAP